MITTLSAMRGNPLLKALIIGLAMVLGLGGLAGCNALRLGYNNAPTLVWWWLDGYADFSTEQVPVAKRSVDRWFDWHRSSQLPAYAAMLATAQAEVLAPTTPEAACRWQDRVRDALEPALQRGLQEAADLVPGLGEEQLRHIERRQAKGMEEMREEFLQPDPAERLRASVDRAVERAERLYGDLDDVQQKLMAAGVAASPFDPEAWQRERLRRQQDTIAVLRRLTREPVDRPQRLAALRALAERSERSPVPEYRSYQERLRVYNCALAARLHNSTTRVQRENARATLKGWEEDLRALSAARVDAGVGQRAD
jgi:hypothetical protein